MGEFDQQRSGCPDALLLLVVDNPLHWPPSGSNGTLSRRRSSIANEGIGKRIWKYRLLILILCLKAAHFHQRDREQLSSEP